MILDITCDSDGAIKHYVDGDDIENTMPFPGYDAKNPPLLGFFMAGAYQEILGNMHNLFGNTEAVDVYVYEGGRIEVKLSDEGDSVADMLSYVQLDPGRLLKAFRDQVRESGVEERLQRRFVDEFSSGLYGYTYLEEEEAPDARPAAGAADKKAAEGGAGGKKSPAAGKGDKKATKDISPKKKQPSGTAAKTSAGSAATAETPLPESSGASGAPGAPRM